MSPVYIYECKHCGVEREEIRSMEGDTPRCSRCEGDMTKKLTPPAIIKVINSGGYPVRSRGYKDGYSKEYLKDNPPSTEF